MKLIRILPISLLISLFGCGYRHISNNEESKWKNDTIVNTAFCYLPDTCIIDKDLYAFAVNLIGIEQVYMDSVTNIECYKTWFNNTDSQVYCDLYRDRGIEIDSCISLIENKIIPEIKKYGANCTASIGEAAWLEFGINQYLALYKSELRTLEAGPNIYTWWLTENDAWLNFMTHLFSLLDYEIGNVTGSSGAYEIPYAFSNISRFRLNCLVENTSDSITADNISLHSLQSLIEEINPEKFDCEQNYMVENVAVSAHKKSAIESLSRWIEIRKEMAEFIDNPQSFNNATLTFVANLSAELSHIRK